MTTEQAFNLFLKDFIPEMKMRLVAVHNASWELETKGSKKAAEEFATHNQKLNIFFSDRETYKKLTNWKKEAAITCPDLLRVLKLLIQEFQVNQVPHDLLEKISNKESELAQAYVKFRVIFEDKQTTENDLLEILKTETNIERREKAWSATKQIGRTLAPKILELVKLRNQKAHRLGYPDFYQMQLKIQETDKDWLFKFLEDFAEDSKEAYASVLKEIETKLSERFQVTPTSLGAWAWSDPFCQEDPLAVADLDELVQEVDAVKAGTQFFNSMGFEVDDILKRSDLFERPNKNQHAFCTHIDREGDIRILTNIRLTIRWLETVLHELGHAVYEQEFDPSLSWILKSPPHMINTEAIALIMGRCAYDPIFLKSLLKKEGIEDSLKEVLKSLQRRQLIFSRWVLVMVHFESSLYQNPEQDLNHLWWSLVQKYQRICPPSHHADKFDWACKYHIGLAPVYYHSYLLGEFFASMLKTHFTETTSSSSLYDQKSISSFLNKKLFFQGNRLRWDRLIEQVVSRPLTYQDWIEEFKI